MLFRFARGSASTLKVVLGGLVVVILGLAAATLALAARMARLRRDHESEAARVPAPLPAQGPRSMHPNR